MISKQDNTSSD